MATALAAAAPQVASTAAGTANGAPANATLRFIALPLDAASRALIAPFVTTPEPATGELLIQAPAGANPAAWAAALAAAGRFQYITPDSWCTQQDEPADPQFPRQWHLRTMHLPQAWQITTGTASVTIAVVDTGIDLAHPDLVSQRVLGANSVGQITWQSSLADPVIADVSGHGTAVAGCISAQTGNGLGVASVGRGIRLLPIKASSSISGGAFLSDILRGVRAAADAHAAAISVSYSGITSPAVQTTGQYVTTAGSLLFWAAGNNAANLGPDSDWPDVIIVGATDRSDTLAAFSARGSAIDLVAPGVAILTTALNSDYSTVDGTSFSTPLAAAAAGLVKSANPSLSGVQIEALLRSTAIDLGDAGKDELYGDGRIDALRAVASAADTTTPIALPDRALCLTGQTRLIPVLNNDADPLGRPLTVTLASQPSASFGAAVVTTDPATGLGAILVSISPDAAPGSVVLPYTISAGGETASSSVTIVIDSASAYSDSLTPLRRVGGLTVTYYQLEVPPTGFIDLGYLPATASGIVPDLNIRTRDYPPDGLIDATNFAASYTGLFIAPVDGEYTLTLEADDAGRITVGRGASAINSTATILSPANITAKLRAGPHAIAVEHYQSDGTWTVALSFASADAGQPFALAALAENFEREVAIADLVSGDGTPTPDGVIDGSDFISFIIAFSDGDPFADLTGPGPDYLPDGTVDGNDFIAFINAFAGQY